MHFNSTDMLSSHEASEPSFNSARLEVGVYEYTISGLLKGERYYVRIFAKNEMGY